ncbi:MAG: hypothetical protein H2040_08175 [Euryhalocaulis sp.]|uniref:hypothetical protein n=1 Tax=Euryhalocaulis sp. TaxID=2744307 RepID=UPI0017F1E1A1|nr:hypothetical protein [Euryhalocaulis sp.]MBA4801828.1 hypothetical protein [Euryhalocaulis sp.]
MTLSIATAETIMRDRLGEPVKPPTNYVIGFKIASGKLIALDRRQLEPRPWFQPPAPPSIEGVRLLSSPSNGNSNLSGPLQPLRQPNTLRAEVSSAWALERFLDWYAGETYSGMNQASKDAPEAENFERAWHHFQELVTIKSGHPFKNFDEGLAAVWESYKPRLRDYALSLLRAESWSESDIGTGAILQKTISAIEIQENRQNLTNNLVFWQNRYGHANRDHRILLEAATTQKLLGEIETLLFELYRGGETEKSVFIKLDEISGGKYPFLAYLFFLNDMDRFMPIQPTGFDRAFNALGVDFTTLRQCSWQNYATYNAILQSLRPLVSEAAGLADVRLVDAHSFCWIYSTLLKQAAEGKLDRVTGGTRDGRVVGGREKSIIAMRVSVENTARNANGQQVQRTLKNKNLAMSSEELDALISSMLDLQDNRCALSGIPFHFDGPDADRNLLPSVDRIDSDGHYEAGNLQIVCRFINFWKSDSDNEEFKRLLMLARGVEDDGVNVV